MNKSHKIFTKIFLHLSLIISLSVFIWHKTLNQTLWGDGYYWFNSTDRGSVLFSADWKRTPYNILMRLIFDAIIPLFRDNLVYYQLIQIILLILLSISLYFAVYKLTNKKLIAFISNMIFISNYGGIYEMIAEGNLNRFLERVPNLILVIAGIYFLAAFLENRKLINILVSWFLFSFGVYLGHFGSFVLPFYIFYPVIYSFDRKKILKSLTLGGIISSTFLIANFLIIRNSDQRSGYALSYYLNPSQRFFEKIFLMTTPLIIPREIVINIAHYFSEPVPYVSLVQIYTAILIFISIIVGICLVKIDKKIFKIYLTCILTMLTGTALMIYTDPDKYNPLKNFGAGRHVFIQSIFYSIILGSLIALLLQIKGKLIRSLTIIFILTFVLYNTNLSWRDISSNQYLYEGQKKYLAYIKSIYPKFNSKTIVVTGTTLIQSSLFINDFYGPPYNITFMSAPEDIKTILNTDKKNIYVIDIDYNVTREGIFPTYGGKIIDLSDLYRSGKIDLYKDWGTKKVKYFESLNN